MQERRPDHRHDAGADVPTDPPEAFDEGKARRGVRLLLEAVGRDPDEAGVAETWTRRVPDLFETLTEGRRPEGKPTMRTFDAWTDGLVIRAGIPLYSTCEHHLLPFHGVAHAAYRPGEEMGGRSKLVRDVRWHARRLTTREELTRDVARGIAEELDARGVVVETTAIHTCEAMRGVEAATETTTREQVGTLPDARSASGSTRRSGDTPAATERPTALDGSLRGPARHGREPLRTGP